MKNYFFIVLFTVGLMQVSFAADQKISNLGVSAAPINEAPASNSKAKVKNGVVVTEVNPNSIASDLGLKKNDIISAVNGQDIINADQLTAIIKRMKTGDNLVVTISRNNKTWELKAIMHEHAGMNGGTF